MRSHALGNYTYYNALAYYFGVTSDDRNIFANSPYSLINHETNVLISEETDK
jgi:hypothetical protein